MEDNYVFKRIGATERLHSENWMLSEDQMRSKCLEIVFINGNTSKIVSKEKVPLMHREMLRVFEYVVDMPSNSFFILTDKAFEDRVRVLKMEPIEDKKH